MVYLWLTNWKKIHTNVQEKNPLLTFSCMFRAMKKTQQTTSLIYLGFVFVCLFGCFFFSWIFLHDHAENLGDSSNINQLIGMTWLVFDRVAWKFIAPRSNHPNHPVVTIKHNGNTNLHKLKWAIVNLMRIPLKIRQDISCGGKIQGPTCVKFYSHFMISFSLREFLFLCNFLS